MQVNHRYFPHTQKDIEEMLAFIGVSDVRELYSALPNNEFYQKEFDIPHALGEMDLAKKLEATGALNKKLVSFLGAGSYESYTPAAVKSLASRQEFLTSYTPYQAEISQGTLQYIFEFQSLVCELTGMDSANASMYDGATATVEAIFMACAHTKRNKVLVASTVDPKTLDVIKTYTKYRNIEVELVKMEDYTVSLTALKSKLDETVAAFVLQTPNFFGYMEDASFKEILLANKTLFIVNSAMGDLVVLKSPAEMGADIACGEAQGMGIPLSSGGPYLGYLACTKTLFRKLPGRIVGITTDVDGKRAFVLTLQAREQHIKRERASSNICSNQSLMAFQVLVYSMLLGKNGLTNTNLDSFNKAHYLYNELLKLNTFEKVTSKEFFKEFTIKYKGDIDKLNKILLEKGILGGLNLEKRFKNLKSNLLLCVTYTKSKSDIDEFVAALREVK